MIRFIAKEKTDSPGEWEGHFHLHETPEHPECALIYDQDIDLKGYSIHGRFGLGGEINTPQNPGKGSCPLRAPETEPRRP